MHFVIRLFAELPKRIDAQVIGRGALRSGTSVGAQYRQPWSSCSCYVSFLRSDGENVIVT